MPTDLIKNLLKKDPSPVIIPTEGSHKAYLVSRLFLESKKSVAVIVKDRKAAGQFMDELAFFLPEYKKDLIHFPGYHLLPFKSLSYHKQTSIERLAALAGIMEAKQQPVVVVTCVETILQKLIPRKSIHDFEQLIMANEEIDRDELVRDLEAGGYIRTSLVEDPGEYSVRGDILDVFSPGLDEPVRVEFFGDLAESVRHFSVFTQRATRDLTEAVILPATEAIISSSQQPHILARLRKAGTLAGLSSERIRSYVNQVRENGRFPGIESLLSIVYEELDTFFDYLCPETRIILDSPDQLESSAHEFEDKSAVNYQSAASENRLCVAPESICQTWNEALDQISRFSRLEIKPVEMISDADEKNKVLRFSYQDNLELVTQLRSQEVTEQPLKPFVHWMEAHLEKGISVFCVLSQEAQAKRLISLLSPYGFSPVFKDLFKPKKSKKAGLFYLYGDLNTGFAMPDQGFSLVTENEIFGKKRIRRRSDRSKDLKTQLVAPEELKDGDIIVHIEHGVGQYQGLCNLEVNGISQDFILLVYQDNDKLYLPVDRIEMIGKYVGVDGYSPVLDKIGSKSWGHSKAKARQEVEKLAADLLDLYARRKVQGGFAFSRPDNYYNDFEAAFEYEETRDQLKAIDDVLLDMESATPMDRLVCGDVGYGKTEVAIRAAFKAVNDSKQVAVVVPTTILAEQHLVTFRERFEKYPIEVACLSRFRSRKEQTQILKDLKKGRVDVVIGTHRLLQKDVEFNALGLLVIDEEQRFGVKHKEALKKKRSAVDVLALTATPIPRTLHLSLTGMRDISVIATPPADRQAIVSYISKYEQGVVKEAIQREMARKGQIFFVHNNIKTIDKIAQELSALVPKARIEIAHGRLSETQLEKVMFKFVNHEVDILVATTIIESGLDIPSANTMIINKAERFGLSQIYQLRGRIGRGDHQAYAYLFISDENQLSKDAQKRLAALMEHRDLGSGFQIAMKDLQIRGAGTALGASQSGHIAAVGYDMFLKLLDQAVKDLKGEKVVEPLEPEINAALSAGFPIDYIESVEQRLTLYRRLSRMSRVSDISDIKKEMEDRYGKLPARAENMLLKIMLRVLCIQAGVKRLDITPNALVLAFSLEHRNEPLHLLEKQLKKTAAFEIVKQDTIRISLGKKNRSMAKAVLSARTVLKALA